MNQLTLEKNRLFYYLENIKSENLGFSFSLLFHLLLLLFAIGLPNFFDPQPISIPTIIPIEIINISEVTSIPKKINEIKPAEIQQKKVKEKKFNSSDIQEIQKVDIKEKPIIKIKKIEKNETPKQDIVIKEKKEIPIKLEKEKLKIDTNQVESLPTKKIKPKLKPKPNLLNEEIEKQPEVTVKEKIKPKPNPVIKKLEKKPDVEIKPKPKPKQDPELQRASLLKNLLNEKSTIELEKIEKKTEEKDEVIAKDHEKKIDKEAEDQAKISIANAIVQQIQQCWIINSGERKREFKKAQYIVAEVEYNKNGSIVTKSVQIIDTNISEASILISGVKYALYNCRLKLPKEYYYLWKKNKIRFDHDFLIQKNMNLFN